MAVSPAILFMQYNSHSDNQDIVSLIGDQTGVSTTNEIKQITRAANKANRQVWSWIFESYGFQYDDSNNSNLPVATTTLKANQQKYTLPSEALTVKALEYKNSNGDWQKLIPLTLEEINQKTSEKEFEDTPAEPRFYVPMSGIVKLYPASDTERSLGLRIQFDRGATTFNSTDTTKTPGFASEFHDAVAVGASYEIAKNHQLPQANALLGEWQDYERRIKGFYSERYAELYPITFKRADLARQFE